MSPRLSHLGLLAAVALATPALTAARAADLDDYGYADAPQEMPVAQLPQAKVEFGTGWYVRGDIAATEGFGVLASRVTSDSEYLGIKHNHAATYDLSLGGGYSFTNGLRADINADFHQPSSTFAFNQPCITNSPATGLPVASCDQSGKFRGYDALINGYYDFGTWHRFTPYVGAGVGVAFGNANATLTGDPSGATYQASSSYMHFAFALMAGVAIDILPHTKLDIGYRYLNNGRFAGTDIYYNEFRAGLRYMIDN